MKYRNARDIYIYSTSWCPDCKRAKKFFADHRIPYINVDIEDNLDGMTYVESVNDGKKIIPTILFPDGSLLVEPSHAELAEKFGIQTQASQDCYDVIIIGGGPAGLTAALYLARDGYNTLVIEKSAFGGQAGITQVLDNFPGFPEGISGDDFARRLEEQAERFGVETISAQEVQRIEPETMYFNVHTSDGSVYVARTILITTGASYRRLGAPGEEKLIGANLHFCATCDGAFYKGKKVLVIGGGNSGFEEGLFLTKFAAQVDIVEFQPVVRASQIFTGKSC